MDLKPCPTPWCDHPEPPYLWQGPTDDFTFICSGCQVEGPYAATEEFARDAWNTRVSLIPEDRVVERLRAQTLLVDRLCNAVDLAAEDIGHESIDGILGELGPENERCIEALGGLSALGKENRGGDD